ncbi:MAG: FAD-binding oxidoreductase [Planctomycetota bacterium]
MSGNGCYDAIVIGAGSVGVPTALFLTQAGLKVLVLDQHDSAGQGENKAAIGGVRATHSDPAKIQICLDSLRLFSTWKEEHGDEIGWKEGGYCFPVYREKEEQVLKGILPIQKGAGLDIDWVGPDRIREIVPGINEEGLRGGTFSPGDGQVSPLLAVNAWRHAAERGCATFRFRERVTAIPITKGRVEGVVTDKGSYSSRVVVNAAGSAAREVGALAGIDVPVTPDSHEAGISSPVAPFLGPLIVDLRPGPEGRTANFYFGQDHRGAIIFCYTPIQLFVGSDRDSTSEFAPIVARRLVSLIPRLKNLLIRRLWRGLYPMTPDGVAIVDRVKEIEGLYLGAGMCGQGFMMGPGVGKNLASLIVNGRPVIDPEVFSSLRFDRDFYKAKKEALR